jgi:hypothetical protein
MPYNVDRQAIAYPVAAKLDMCGRSVEASTVRFNRQSWYRIRNVRLGNAAVITHSRMPRGYSTGQGYTAFVTANEGRYPTVQQTPPWKFWEAVVTPRSRYGTQEVIRSRRSRWNTS